MSCWMRIEEGLYALHVKGLGIVGCVQAIGERWIARGREHRWGWHNTRADAQASVEARCALAALSTAL